MFSKEFDDINLDDLQALVDGGIPEGRQREFKRGHYGRKDDDRREFAADVSAMANALGGYLLIGIDEKNGIASDVCGVEQKDPDELVIAVSNSILASLEPKFTEFRVKWVPIEGDWGVLVIKIARSWNAPHRVTVARDYRFFIRDENGKHPMSVDELRRAFLFASEVEERIRRFRSERLEILVKNEGPLGVGYEGNGQLILLVVPRAAFTDGIRLAFDTSGVSMWPSPTSWRGANQMYSLDGFVRYSRQEESLETVKAFSTLFRNGIVEAVESVHIDEIDGRRQISLAEFEYGLSEGLSGIFGEYKRRSIPAPYTIFLSILGIRGVSTRINPRSARITHSYRSDRLILPELVIDAVGAATEPEIILKPLFDLMWNAFGERGSPNYDQSGKYMRR